MGDAEINLQSSKKRAAGRELSRDNPGLDDEDETSEQESGTFKRASDEVLASRRIVKVRRNQPSSTPPSSNPFAGIRLVPPPDSGATIAVVTSEADTGRNVAESEVKTDGSEETVDKTEENNKQLESKVDETKSESTSEKDKNDNEDGPVKLKSIDDKAEDVISKDVEADNVEKDENDAEVETTKNGDKKDDGNGTVDKSGEAASFSFFQQLSSNQNAFTGLAGTGFSSSTFSFGSIAKEGSSLVSESGSLFGLKNDPSSFGFGLSNNGSSSLFGTSGASTISKSERIGFPSMQDAPLETGEENEKPVFLADSALFEYLDGAWKERGKGELKVNIPATGTAKARLVMRTRGNYRLVLNVSLFPDMKLTNMDKRGISFACVNSVGEGKGGLSTFALKFKDASVVEEFRTCVMEHKDKTAVALKTPENSPKASDD
ncbi:hypothetical protein ACH5RR_024530 [Cinchona calisaya]|uniref:RanBD1 domain-containing protein n=1 Tax=Cinchona calisaya TaxID=153742 RepID=A0ABD2YX02_9GENT